MKAAIVVRPSKSQLSVCAIDGQQVFYRVDIPKNERADVERARYDVKRHCEKSGYRVVSLSSLARGEY